MTQHDPPPAVENDAPLAPMAQHTTPPEIVNTGSTTDGDQTSEQAGKIVIPVNQVVESSPPTETPTPPVLPATSTIAPPTSDSPALEAPLPSPLPIPTADKGKGRAIEPEPVFEEPTPTPADLSSSDSPHSNITPPPTSSPPTHTNLPVEEDLPGRIERFSLASPAPPPSDVSPPAVAPPATPPKPARVEEDEEEWILKEIAWPPLPPPPSAESNGALGAGPTIRIITQNRNGPCSLIALCNILILRGDILITPPHRPSVSYSYLSSLFADYLLRVLPSSSSSPDTDLSAALEILPTTRYGLSLNPRFGSIDGFRPPESGSAGELALFSLSKIDLLHGWVVDPQDEATWEVLVGEAGDYDKAVEMVVEGEVVSGGLEGVDGNEEEMLQAIERRSQWTPDEERKVNRAHIISKFLSTSRTQLTYHGLFLLSSHLAPSSLSALFRNSHLSVIYRRPSLPPSSSAPGPELFTLVTDSAFTGGEQPIVWESLEDVEGGASEFFDGALRRIDLALARQLQHEEDQYARQQRDDADRRESRRDDGGGRRQESSQHQHQQQQPPRRQAPDQQQQRRDERPRREPSRDAREKEKKDKCVVM
ncbi:hypothetical protein RQP46_007209 [Phenoliferia psychrophenolica]